MSNLKDYQSAKKEYLSLIRLKLISKFLKKNYSDWIVVKKVKVNCYNNN